MTRRACIAQIVNGHERWKQRFHYREGSLAWQMGAEDFYPWSFLFRGLPSRRAPASVAR